jgi:flavin reductase (DIM6/NTAB) family NADH-FMN oxidoreductase RutF
LVTKDEFRQCMSEFATGVTVVTTLDDADKVHGMSANSFTSVCLDPPLVLICVGHNTNTFGFVEQRGRFGVNILSARQEAIGRYFARKPEDRHDDVYYEYSLSDGGVPALKDTIVFFECHVVGSHVHGDHTVYIAEVKAVRRGEPNVPLLFFQSKWFADGEVR